jgi:hypothetical protein
MQDNVSFAGLVGSIDQETKEITTPLAVLADHKVLLMDEMVRDDKGMFTKAMNQFLERGEYSRTIAVASKKNMSLYNGRFTIRDGTLFVKSKFSVIMATMYSPSMFFRTPIGSALVDRCIVLQFEETPEERTEYHNPHVKKAELFCDLGLNPQKNVDIPFADYCKLWEFWKENDKEANRRRFGDLIRCFAVLGKHDEETYRELIAIGTPYVVKIEKPKWRS